MHNLVCCSAKSRKNLPNRAILFKRGFGSGFRLWHGREFSGYEASLQDCTTKGEGAVRRDRCVDRPDNPTDSMIGAMTSVAYWIARNGLRPVQRRCIVHRQTGHRTSERRRDERGGNRGRVFFRTREIVAGNGT